MTICTTTNQLTFSTIEPNSGLRAALSRPPADALRTIAVSGLRGRGGAGFPTSLKWELAAKSPGPRKYAICNADEGEPGTFKDRVILADFADLVIEGMTIGAWVIGASQGIVYLRAEYTYLRPHLEAVLERRRSQGLLGPAVAGHDAFAFDMAIRMGSGAYVCGEETALIESLEGQRGEPRNRPPIPHRHRLPGQPDDRQQRGDFRLGYVHLVERGRLVQEHRHAEIDGTEALQHLRRLCPARRVRIPDGHHRGANCCARWEAKVRRPCRSAAPPDSAYPPQHFDRTIAFEDISTGGSVIVLAPHRDLLRVAQNFLEFFLEESCGQCTPCREGIPRLIEGVRLLQQGRCSVSYLRELCALGETMQQASKCGLGQSAPNAMLSIVEHFRDEILGRAGAD